MKNYKEFLTEAYKTYKFKIRVAGDIPEGFEDRMELNLKKFDLVNVSTGKRSPISEKPLDFPQLHNLEVTHYDAEVKYPVSAHALEKYIVDNCSIPHSHIIVRGEFDPIEEQQAEKEDKPYETILTQEDMGGESAQESVGANRVMDLLKELETARKEKEVNHMEGVPAGESKDIDDKQNTVSPVGSK